MANQNYFKNKTPDFIDIQQSDIPISTSYGVYVGVVKAIDTEFRNGRLYVYIPGFSTGDPNNPTSLPQVTYASPFLGRTLGELSSAPGLFTRTGQSYGMAFPLPDLDTTVLCCFPAGQREYGYWFACVSNKLSRNMVPDIGAISGKLLVPESIPNEILPLINSDQNYPVGEINEQDGNVFKSDWYKNNKRPLHLPRIMQLWNQGLDADTERGIITSSTQRDPISSAYGLITPGRPVDDPGKDPTILTGVKNRNIDSVYAQKFDNKSRIGGHSFVLDDGDFTGKNNLVRLRSSAGHQIIMNDSEGFMYVSTASGKNWIELTKNGDLLIYSEGDVAVRSEGNMFFTADKQINLDAFSININAEQNINIQSNFFRVNAKNNANIYSNFLNLQGRSATLNATSRASINSSLVNIAGGTIYLNSGGSGGSVRPPPTLPTFSFKDVKGVRYPVSSSLTKFTPSNQPYVDLWVQEPNANYKSINQKVPTHEPYSRSGESTRQGTIRAAAATVASVDFLSVTGTATDLLELTKTYPGIASAVLQPVNQVKKAPLSKFITQPVPAENIGPLTTDQTQALMAQIGYAESTGEYDVINKQGYVGKYQLSSSALEEVGYLKPGTPQTAEAINNPNNWRGGSEAPANVQEFLNNPAAQEQAMQNYTKNNYAKLEESGLVNQNSSAETVSGMVAASHVGGVKTVDMWAKGGIDITNQSGNSLSSNFQLGRFSQTQAPIITTSNATKPS